MKKLFTLFLLVSCALNMCAEMLQYGGIYYNILNDSTLEVAVQPSCSSTNECLTYTNFIPGLISGVKKYTVVGVVDSAFYKYSTLAFVKISLNMTYIGTKAFYGCTSLTKVISDAVNVPILGDSVFVGCPLADATLYVPEESVEQYRSAEQWKEFGTILPINAMATDNTLFPTLVGLQRTSCATFSAECDYTNRLEWLQRDSTIIIPTDKVYLKYDKFYLREEDNKILIYCQLYKKDLVLYDFTLDIGDTLTTLNALPSLTNTNKMFVYDIPVPDESTSDLAPVNIDTLTVTNVSAITLLDGKEYKKWTFNNGMEYVEGIGSLSGDFFQLINQKRYNTCLDNNHLVCASQNGVMLYQMDDAEMDRLGAECLCEGYVGTSVETIITSNTNASKLIQDGQLFILRDGKTYNVMGMEVK